MTAVDTGGIKVSAIITSYNRYSSLMTAVDSVRKQTHPNVEIIVINDKSDMPEYGRTPPGDVTWIDLETSSREALGFPSCGYTKNAGIAAATGDYVAFLDDDDAWLPDKVKAQLDAMVSGGWTFSCSEALIGGGPFDEDKDYAVYHAGYFETFSRDFFERHYGQWRGKLPDVFDLELIEKHNFVIVSSVMVQKKLLDDVGPFRETRIWDTSNGGPEDRDLWKRILRRTDCLHINRPLVYIDGRLSENTPIRKFVRKIRRIVARLGN